MKEPFASSEEISGEYSSFLQLDFGCAVWSNRHFIAFACIAFMGGVLIAVINNNPIHYAVAKLGGDSGGALMLPDKNDALLETLDAELSFIRIAAQNIQSGIHTFVLGISFGIGTLIMLIINGAAVGCMLLMLLNSSSSYEIAASIVAHAPMELIGLITCGAAGLRLGWGLIRAIASSSIWHLQVATLEALCLACISTIMLVTASGIEAFISFSVHIPSAFKVVIGVVTILTMLVCIQLSRLHWLRHGGQKLKSN
ncbi:MAG: stage II sporulation protein M [Armatimonadota bacterium]|nr:stage II sporulation protein M [Armatimonadota bacterium]MCX7778370.1 stage II sporulation protein M [Armatimonadota bacterium]MDW8026364.1 stage II sporulation protein M [Armatimonadota bacterium]